MILDPSQLIEITQHLNTDDRFAQSTALTNGLDFLHNILYAKVKFMQVSYVIHYKEKFLPHNNNNKKKNLYLMYNFLFLNINCQMSTPLIKFLTDKAKGQN